MYKKFLLRFAAFTLVATAALAAQVKTGADLLFEKRFDLIEGKRLGLVTNHSAVLSNGKHLADALFENPKAKLVVLFGPEHGIRGQAPAGKSVRDSIDTKTRIPVYSLYGRINKPTAEMLKNVDVLIFDIQDIGARFYTYESTLSLAMEAAAENRIPFIVLDRPNPITGTRFDGFVLVDSLRSFVGMHRISIMHGMTMGELATMINQEGWLKNGVRANLDVVRMEGWKRDVWFDETQLTWIGPSPNMQSLQTAIVYPGSCLFEGTNFSEGRGTEKPFEYIGSPFVNGKQWADELNSLRLPGITFEPIVFVPQEIQNVVATPKHKGVRCEGVFLHVLDRN
ncbi:MAG: DUF1343 domain-containing protein, partial [Bacteroidota bacterium]